jgi:prepilin-type N-terminal cleavage/methylation domain-containing protein
MKIAQQSKSGFTLIELIMAAAASLIVLLAAAMLTFSGHKDSADTYKRNNSDLQVGTIEASAALGVFGRKANKTDYRIYKIYNNKFERALPETDPEEIVVGEAAEFHYWKSELNSGYLDASKKADSYILFYVENHNLKTDYGPYPPGGINPTGGRITGDGITTITLIRNVTSVEFSHTTYNMAGDGNGCVRMKLTATDPVSGNSKVILAATFMRNTWP